VRLEVALVKDLLSTRFGVWEERIEMKFIEEIKRKGPLTNWFMRKRTIIVVEEKGSDYFY